METNVNYTLVGAFVIIMIAAITLGIIWLSSGFSFQNYTTYSVYWQEAISGLSVDAPVEYNGVSVGNVKSIRLSHKNPQLVEVLLTIKSSTPITKGTEATLNTRGITGMAYVALKDKGTDLRKLVVEDDQPYPVIKTAPSIFMRLETSLSELSVYFRQVAQSIQALLDKDNLHSIKETLHNLQKVSGTLAANSNRMNLIFVNAANASKNFTPFMQSSNNAMRMLETQTLPAAYRLLSNLEDVSHTLSEAAIEIKQNPSVLIRGVHRQNLGPGETK